MPALEHIWDVCALRNNSSLSCSALLSAQACLLCSLCKTILHLPLLQSLGPSHLLLPAQESLILFRNHSLPLHLLFTPQMHTLLPKLRTLSHTVSKPSSVECFVRTPMCEVPYVLLSCSLTALSQHKTESFLFSCERQYTQHTHALQLTFFFFFVGADAQPSLIAAPPRCTYHPPL